MAYNILIIDDSSIVRKSLIKSLAIAGVDTGEIFEAENGAAGLEVLRNNWIDLIFLDINMPVMNGMEFMQAIRSDELFKNIAVIIISTEGSLIRGEELKALRVTVQLHKPVRPEVLNETILNVLGVKE